MSIRQAPSESTEEYSDRFTSMVTRTSLRDDDETLKAVFIQGLDPSLQDLMHVALAAILNMWKRTNKGTPSVSIADEISSAITLDSSLTSSRDTEQTSMKTQTEQQMQTDTKKKQYGNCRSTKHSTKKHWFKTEEGKHVKGKHLDAETRKLLRKEALCFECEEIWKPGHN